MSRSTLPLALAAALLPVACTQSSGGGGADDSALVQEAQALRRDMLAAGMEPVSAPPAVSDELFVLGQALFFDKLLSGNEEISCATCHLPEFGTSDRRNLSNGVHGTGLGPDRDGGTMINRNSPALFALHERSELFWDGRTRLSGGHLSLPDAVLLPADHRLAFQPGLELMAAQAMLPPVSREEMRGGEGENPLGDLPDGYNSFGGTPDATVTVWVELADRLLSLPRYQELFRDAYPGVALTDFNFGHVGNAIAAFEARAFALTDSPFERFLRGEDKLLSWEELRGGREFLEAGCAECHHGALLSDEEFHNTGLPQIGPGSGLLIFGGPSIVPPPFNRSPDVGREAVSRRIEDRYRFRTPSLLNVELTGPYGHAGQFERLEDFVRHYRDVGNSLLNYDILANVTDPTLAQMLINNQAELLSTVDVRFHQPNDFAVAPILTFLHTLTDERARTLEGLVPSSVPSGLPLF